MAAHAYWRVLVLAVDNDTSTSLEEVEFRTSIGGSQAATGGTAISGGDNGSFPASNAFDGTSNIWVSDGNVKNSAREWIGYHFASSVDIAEVAIKSRSSNFDQTPRVFRVEYSDDGSAWSIASIHATPAWTASLTRTFTVSANFSGEKRFWRLELYNANGYIGSSEIELRATLGGAQLCTGGAGFIDGNTARFGGTLADTVFDGSTSASAILSNTTDPKYWGYCFPSAPGTIVQLSFRNRDSGGVTDAPSGTDGIRLAYSDDGDSWTQVGSWTPATWTTNNQEQTFAITVAYTLTATQQSYAATTQAATLTVARRLTAAQQSYALTLQDAALIDSSDAYLTATQQSYTVTPQAATFSVARKLTADYASVAWTVIGATLLKTSYLAPLVAETAMFTVTYGRLYRHLPAIATDSIWAGEWMDGAKVFPEVLADGVELAVTLPFGISGRVTDLLQLASSASLGQQLGVVLVERTGVTEAVGMALDPHAAETVAVTPSAAWQLALTIAEALGLTSTVVAPAKTGYTQVEQIGIDETLLRFLHGGVSDTVNLTPVVAIAPSLGKVVTEALGLTDTAARVMVARALVTDGVEVTPLEVLQRIMGVTVLDGVVVDGLYIGPNQTTVTWALNTQNLAMTQYLNYEFNSFAQMGRRYLGASPEGLYWLDGDTDAGDDIWGRLRSGFAQFGGSRLTAIDCAYIGMRTDNGQLLLKVDTGDGKSYMYQVVAQPMATTKVRMGKGLRARYFAFELQTMGQDFDLDSIEFVPIVASRRV